MGYLDAEAPLADAYRTAARAVRREMSKDAFVTERVEQLGKLLISPLLLSTRVEPMVLTYPLDEVPIVRDIADWIEEHADKDGLLVSLIVSGDARTELLERYALARAAWEAGRRNWNAEAIEALEWERGGRP